MGWCPGGGRLFVARCVAGQWNAMQNGMGELEGDSSLSVRMDLRPPSGSGCGLVIVSGGFRCARPSAIGLNAFGVMIFVGERRLVERSGVCREDVSGGVRCARSPAIGLNAFGVMILWGSVGSPSVPGFGG